MTPDDITQMFTRTDGSYAFARWGRPIAPIVFGVQDKTLEVLKGALEAVVAMAGHQMAETDPELGSNLMFFFFRDWDELLEVPDLDRLIPDLATLVAKLKAGDANQYRAFRFDENAAIKAAFVFLRVDKQIAKIPAEDLALAQVAQIMLLWSDQGLGGRSPLAKTPDGTVVLHPDIADVIRAGYDPVMPVAAGDASHALRLFARLSRAVH
jgi:hypothetical protein